MDRHQTRYSSSFKSSRHFSCQQKYFLPLRFYSSSFISFEVNQALQTIYGCKVGGINFSVFKTRFDMFLLLIYQKFGFEFTKLKNNPIRLFQFLFC